MTSGRKTTNPNRMLICLDKESLCSPQIPYSVLQKCKNGVKILQEIQCKTQIKMNLKVNDSSSKYDYPKKM